MAHTPHVLDADSEGGEALRAQPQGAEHLPRPLPGNPCQAAAQYSQMAALCAMWSLLNGLGEECSEIRGLFQRVCQRLATMGVEIYEKNTRRLPVPAPWC